MTEEQVVTSERAYTEWKQTPRRQQPERCTASGSTPTRSTSTGPRWGQDHGDQEWLFEPILARGRGHAVYAKHKTGKSLVLLWIATTLATGRPT